MPQCRTCKHWKPRVNDVFGKCGFGDKLKQGKEFCSYPAEYISSRKLKEKIPDPIEEIPIIQEPEPIPEPIPEPDPTTPVPVEFRCEFCKVLGIEKVYTTQVWLDKHVNREHKEEDE